MSKAYKVETGGIWRTGARHRHECLDALFKPKSVAVIGASEKEGSVGGAIVHNLVAKPFGGTVYPVNVIRPSIMGIRAYKTVADIPERVDLGVITTPAKLVPPLVKECVDAKVKSLIIISAGFAEMGEEGHKLLEKIREYTRDSPIRIIGPNCLGVMNPITGLNATFSATGMRPGRIGFITQSGALGTTVIDWSMVENVGFSRFASVGSMMDVSWGDLITYFGDDEDTESILIYMESVGDAQSFMSAARQVALRKPVIVIKAGRTSEAAQAAASHTGTLAGSDDIVDAAFARCGVLRVDSIEELFDMARVLSKQPLPKGPHMTIVTNAGGPGVLAADALCLSGGSLTKLSQETFDDLSKVLPGAWSRNNPVDILGDAPPSRYAAALDICLKDKNADGYLVILTPQEMTDPAGCAKKLTPFADAGKPVLASWMGGLNVREGARILEDGGIPCFQFSDQACRAFTYMWQYCKHLKQMYETPRLATSVADSLEHKRLADDIINAALATGRTILTEKESKDILEIYGLPVTKSGIAETEDEAVALSNQFGYPVVLKIHSKTITHKTDVGGVKLNLKNESEVRKAFSEMKAAIPGDGFDGANVQPMYNLSDSYEVILGSTLDAQFGPVVLFGFGGTLVEVFEDRALGLPPLNTTLAHKMLEQTKIFKALKGVRGRPPCDIATLEKVMVRFGDFVVAHPRVKEVDINPLVINSENIICLDARMVLHPPEIPDETLPKSALRPYPVHYVKNVTLKDHSSCTLRPVRPEDEPVVSSFFLKLSESSTRARYGDQWKLFKDEITHEQLVTVCFNDYIDDFGLIAETEDEVLAVGRLTKVSGDKTCGLVGLIVTDRMQGQGIGTSFFSHMQEIAKKEGITTLRAEITKGNTRAEEVFAKFGFTQTGELDGFTNWVKNI
eukprot:TRINITY_DN2992_c0_g1_i1.p1 TRINITY_DN2992_c0_g1~~TRINITY_DN2992_c0_g1_i1.p1  ORF type:complete len:907 (+),score=246.66 TRINITY_DN2992_c0_g1_i1:3165-5885(+)